ncbi:hypothetical protein EDB80DRAFT_684340 [Ilyonectria destructans]|nr:hypothetical protein EDB80DRAFT_684340 [Ilyonectria destructans]
MAVFHSLFPATLAIHPASGAGPDHPVVPCKNMGKQKLAQCALLLTLVLKGIGGSVGDQSPEQVRHPGLLLVLDTTSACNGDLLLLSKKPSDPTSYPKFCAIVVANRTDSWLPRAIGMSSKRQLS